MIPPMPSMTVSDMEQVAGEVRAELERLGVLAEPEAIRVAILATLRYLSSPNNRITRQQQVALYAQIGSKALQESFREWLGRRYAYTMGDDGRAHLSSIKSSDFRTIKEKIECGEPWR